MGVSARGASCAKKERAGHSGDRHGKYLKGDDGLGVYALRRLAEEGVEGAELLELGTSLSDCFSLLEGYERVVALDAVSAGGEPGSLYWLSEERFARMRGRA